MAKNPPTNAEDGDSIPGSGRSSRVGNDNPLQSSFLENSMDRRAWRAIVGGAAKSQTGLGDRAHLRTSGVRSGPCSEMVQAHLTPTLAQPGNWSFLQGVPVAYITNGSR